MTIKIESGQSGWGNYVLYGTKEVPRDSEKVQFIEGDIALGDRLCESNNYQESYYRIVLGFEGKPSDEVMLGAYEDFKKEMFVGFKEDEYHIDAVAHKDTDNYHIHIRVPKQNLKTDTHLQLYMDKYDRPRKELIQDHISLKYGFNIARETNKKVFKDENTKIDIINKWRSDHKQKLFDLKSKDGQKQAEKEINSYVSELTKSGLVESQNDIKRTLEELGLKVEKFGTDQKKDFSYVTVSNDSGKMRIKGEIYKDEFWKFNREDRTAQIDNNQRIGEQREPNQERAERVRRELNNANEKRFNKVTELFKSSRARAETEHSKTFELGKLESINTSRHSLPNVRNNDRGVLHKTNTNNTNTKDTKQVGAVHREQEFSSNRQQQLPQIQKKRATLRREPKVLLLQNRLKEQANERYYSEAIARIRRERKTCEISLQRARNERETVQNGIKRNHTELQNGVSKIADYYGKIRGKVIAKIEETKLSLKERFASIKEKLGIEPTPKKPEKVKELSKDWEVEKDENLEKFIKKMEASTVSQEAKASNLDNTKKLTSSEKFEEHRERLRQVEKDKSEVGKFAESVEKKEAKRPSYQRQR